MEGQGSPPPPRVPPVTVRPPPGPGPSPAPVSAPLRRPVSVLRRSLVGLVVSVAIAIVGVVPFVGLPGVVPLMVADLVISTVKGTSALSRLTDSSWAAALFVTVLGPLPIAPVLAFVTWKKPALPGAVAWTAAFAAAGAWSLAVAFVLLLAR
ncbi:MAG: hypothetical protein KJ062_14645 [Thermoanaerobaculia bacterium]|nr:hypothetical protein [Thermoanaerobaculia bacterium]